MSRRGGPWRVLGIAPTSDAREIRRAYARTLKTIDVEGDPESFVGLREAYEQATALAEAGEVDVATPEIVAEPTDDERWSGPGETIAQDEPASEPEPAIEAGGGGHADPWREAAIAAAEHGGQALERLLLAHREDWVFASPDEARTMLDHWGAITADPRLEEIDFHSRVEAWIGEVAARATPFSDPILLPVAERFGWIAQAGTIGQPPAVRYLVDRLHLLGFVEQVNERKHPLHKAWVELTTPAGEGSRRGWGASGRRVKELLVLIRRDYPALERELDSWRVSLWENPGGHSVGWPGIGVGIVVALQLLRFCAVPADNPPRSPAPFVTVDRALTQPAADIDEAVKTLSGDHVDGTAVRTDNPALYDDLVRIWTRAEQDRDNPARFQTNIAVLLNERFRRVYDKADYKHIAALRRVELDAALYFRDRNADLCSNPWSGQGAADVPEELTRRRHDAIYDILLSSGADRPGHEPKTTFTIPGTISDRARKRAGLPRAVFSAALMQEGTSAQRCTTRIALLQALLAAPSADSIKVLRAM